MGMDDFVGVIAASGLFGRLDEQRWLKVIEQHPALEVPATQTKTNPFTRQPMQVRPPAGVAFVLVEGRQAGMMEWAQDESHRVVVWGSAVDVAPVAREVASLLGGTFDDTLAAPS